jgi:hypothetical protein
VQIVLRKFPKTTKRVVLAPLGDIQWTGRPDDIAYDMLKAHIAQALEMDAWFIGMGDMLDFLSPSNRQRLRAAALYDTADAVLDDASLALVRSLYEEILKPTTGRWLGLLEGHHFATLTTGDTTDHRLCALLKAPFLGTSAYVRLSFDTHDGTRGVTIWCHHGFGGGQKTHSPLLKLENLAAHWEADIFLMGHHSKQGAAPINRIYPVYRTVTGIPTLKSKALRMVGTGAWFKAYVEGALVGGHPRGNYVEQKGLNPVALGAPFVTIEPRTVWEPQAPGTKNGHRLWDPHVRVIV